MMDRENLTNESPVSPAAGKKGSPHLRWIKGIIILPLLLFGIWLIKLVYLPDTGGDKQDAGQAEAADGGIFVRILSDQQLVPRGHFHLVDEHLDGREPYRVLCLNCHGTYPHRKEKKTRALLNFHGGFMDCTVCHVRRQAGDAQQFLIWMNHRTGGTSRIAEGSFGEYSAKISLVKAGGDGRSILVQPVSENEARTFLKLKEQFSPDQMARAKIKLHEGVSAKPVFCTECHKQDGYLNFADLGFPKNRVDNLTSSEIARMIENYETFYIPKEIDFTGP